MTPTHEAARWIMPDVKPLSEISNLACLVLLGEPGLGKSTELRTASEAGEPGSIFIDLGKFITDSHLSAEIFDNPTMKDWFSGTGTLTLFLDSLDECKLRVETVARLLADNLRRLPSQRLRIRIACRTLDWPISLEEAFRELWGAGSVGVYELLRLTREDVAEAARGRGLDEQAFLEAVGRHGVGPLACKPVTLSFLLEIFQRPGQLPSDQISLYADGCRLLCQEVDFDRAMAAARHAVLSPDQRLLIAGRIAAVTLLASRTAIFTGLEDYLIGEGDVSVRQLAGGQEQHGQGQVEVNEAAIREVLGSALFSSRGAERLGWDHQSYAEFLAARYLSRPGFQLAQVLSLLLLPVAGGSRVIPQLAGTTAWLSTMRKDVFAAVLERDPQVLVRGGLRELSDGDKVAVTAALLKRFDQGQLVDSDFDVRRGYRNLKHSTLATQLRPYLADPSRNIVVRRVAIDIAEACEVTDLTEDLSRLALDHAEDSHIRSQAARALLEIGTADAKAEFLHLLGLPIYEDPEDELKGIALSALWPQRISAVELFGALSPPRRHSFFGAYRRFLTEDLVSRMGRADIPAALTWVGARTPDEPLSPLSDVEQQILHRASQQLEEPAIVEAFANVLLLRRHTLFLHVDHESMRAAGTWLANKPEARRRVAEAVVSHAVEPSDLPAALVYSRLRILTGEDFPWLLEKVLNAPGQERPAWLRLARSTFDPGAPRHPQLVLERVHASEDLARAFADWIEPIELGSEQANELRRRYELMWLPEQAGEPAHPALEPPLEKRLRSCLDRFEGGDSNAWWILNREMAIDPATARYGSESASDLRQLPGWQLADEGTRERICSAAQRYLELRQSTPERWFGKNVLYRSVDAGYRALRLLLSETPQMLDQLDSHIWKNWAPIVVCFPEHGGPEAVEAQRDLIAKAYQRAPAEILQFVSRLITQENRRGYDIADVLANVAQCWDERLAEALTRKLLRGRLNARNYRLLLRTLLDHGVEAAGRHALSTLKKRSAKGSAADRSIQAGVALFQHDPAGARETLLRVGRAEPARAREIFLEVATCNRHRLAVAQKLSERQLAELYVWLAREFPPDEDPQHDGFHAVGRREAVADFRDGLLRNLRDRGTEAACVSLDWIASELPHLELIRWLRPEAEQVMLEQEWRPAEAAEILELARRSEARLVQTAEQLGDVVIESLKRLESELLGETPLVGSLWNELSPGVWRPKDEGHLSDVVKVHLERDLRHSGIIAFREVEIRSTKAVGAGQVTDIHVDVSAPGSAGRPALHLKLVVEVKGCWNANLKTDMENQLRNRYLQESDCRQGIYMVGWFACDRWDDADYRKQQTPKWPLEEARNFFDRQAAQLSAQGIHIRAFVLDTALRGSGSS